MTLRQRRTCAWSILAVAIVAGAGWLARLDFRQKISIDVLDLIPADEREPQLALVRELASQAEARTMLFVLTDGNGAPVSLPVTREFAAALRRSPGFSEAVALADPGWREAFGRELFELRFTLLFPLWLRQQQEVFRAAGASRFDTWLATTSAAELEAFLRAPQAVAFQDLVPADPLLLVPRTLEGLGQTLSFVVGDASAASAPGLVWAQVSASPLTEQGQEPVFAAIEDAASALRAKTAGLAVAYTGVNRFAHASRARIQREVTWLNAASLLAVLTVAAIFIRRLWQGLHLVPVVLLSLLAGWVATTAVFERVHIVVFVLGSLLAGVAIDYGFHIYAQPRAAPGEAYATRLRRLLKPLLASCLTTAIGFALLLLAELPLLRQLGVFVIAGLVGAAGGSVLYFSALREPWLETRAVSGPWLRGRGLRRRRAPLLIWLAVPAAIGLARVTWRDDIRELEVPATEVQREDARIRGAFGQRPDRTVWLTQGRTLDEARIALRALESQAAITGAPMANLGAIVPAAQDLDQALRFGREHAAFGRLFRGALERRGFSPAEFTAFFDAWDGFVSRGAAGDLPDAVARLQRTLVGPMGLLLHTGARLNWFVTVVGGRMAATPPPGPGTIAVSQLQSLNDLFTRYRQSALRLSLIGLVVIGAGVTVAYGLRDGLRIFAIPCGACLAMFGLFGWVGQPLNMFHLLGAFLGVCLTHDYAIFSVTSARRGEPPPVSVRLAALTTAASFGVLALSAIPAVRALGASVALMVMTALFMIELEPRPGEKS